MTTHLPEARGWPRPQCSHDSLCRPGQTSERRSQCHHLLRLQSNYNSKLATWTTVGAPHLQMDAQSKFNHSVVYTKHGVYCWKYVHEVKRLLKEAGERILRVIHSIYPPHTVSLALQMYAMQWSCLSCRAHLCNNSKWPPIWHVPLNREQTRLILARWIIWSHHH